jgi:predicted site-specific integrase-resolvase
MTQESRLLTPSQASQRLREAGLVVSDETLRTWAKAGRVPATRLPSGRYVFRPADVDAILADPQPAEVT